MNSGMFLHLYAILLLVFTQKRLEFLIFVIFRIRCTEVLLMVFLMIGLLLNTWIINAIIH